MSIQDDFKKAYIELRKEFGVGVSFGGVPIVAIVGEDAMSRELVAGGVKESVDYNAKVLLEDLPTVPAFGSPVVYNGIQLKVTKRAIQPNHPIGEFTLTARNR